MHANNRETIYSAGSGDWLITVSGLARTVPMSHRDKQTGKQTEQKVHSQCDFGQSCTDYWGPHHSD